MKNKNYSYHEVISEIHSENHKMFFDVDAKKDGEFHDIFEIIDGLKSVCRNLGYTMVDFYYTKNTHKDAYHIYSKCSISSMMNRLVAEKCNEILGYQAFDLMIYRKNASLRLPMTPKIAKDESGKYNV